MSEENAQEEPTMEEILASIRRIISEDGDDSKGKAQEAAPEPELKPEPEPEPKPEPEPEPEETMDGAEEEDVLELTEVAEEEAEAKPAGAPAPADALVGKDAEAKVAGSLDALSALMVAGYEGDRNTLEGLVREMLKPMLKNFLDENLPRIVEDMVEREVARISRRK